MKCLCTGLHCGSGCCDGEQCYFITDGPGSENRVNEFGCLDASDGWQMSCTLRMDLAQDGRVNRTLKLIERNHHVTVCCSDTQLCNQFYYQRFVQLVRSVDADASQNATIAPQIRTSEFSPTILLLLVFVLVLLALALVCIFAYIKHRGSKHPSYASSDVPTVLSSTSEIYHTDMAYGTALCRTIANDIRLGSAVGSGRFGSVFRAMYKDDEVAVKKFVDADLSAFQNERSIYTCCSMTHQNVLHFLAADTVTSGSCIQWWLITEYCSLGSLYCFLNLHTLTLDAAMRFCLDMANGLAFLHKEIIGIHGKPAIAHRDLKSGNILVRADKRCVIGDFGQALCYRGYPWHDFDPYSMHVVVGTKRYMAPEVLNKTINYQDFESFKKTDIYSLSLIIWELARRTLVNGLALNYQQPYEEKINSNGNISDFRRVVCEENYRPPPAIHWFASQEMNGLVVLMRECWKTNPDQRLTAFRVKKRLAQMIECYEMDAVE